jgi:hypothetical protein
MKQELEGLDMGDVWELGGNCNRKVWIRARKAKCGGYGERERSSLALSSSLNEQLGEGGICGTVYRRWIM